MSTDVPMTAIEHTLLHRLYYQLCLINEIDNRIVRHPSNRPQALHAPGQYRGNHDICDLALLNAIDPAKDAVFTPYNDHTHRLLQQDDIEAYCRRMALLHNNPHPSTDNHEHTRQAVCEALNNALTARLTSTDAISIVILDANTVERTHLAHYFDVASLWSLPLLIVLDAHEPDSPCTSAIAAENDFTHCLKGQEIRANDLLKIYAFSSAAVTYVRRARRPFLLHLLSDPAAINLHHALANIAHKLSLAEQEEIKHAVTMRVEQALTQINIAPPPGIRV